MRKMLPDCAYYKIKEFMDGHESIHYVFHRTVCPVIKYGDKNKYEER
jgi:hypothetical protein